MIFRTTSFIIAMMAVSTGAAFAQPVCETCSQPAVSEAVEKVIGSTGQNKVFSPARASELTLEFLKIWDVGTVNDRVIFSDAAGDKSKLYFTKTLLKLVEQGHSYEKSKKLSQMAEFVYATTVVVFLQTAIQDTNYKMFEFGSKKTEDKFKSIILELRELVGGDNNPSIAPFKFQ